MTCVCEYLCPDDGPRPDHCWSCHRDQPRRGYIRCFECGHTYRTRWHLLAAYWRIVLQMDGWLGAWRAVRVRPGRISFCQCCIHDF